MNSSRCLNASDLTHLSKAANPDLVQAAAAGCWRIEQGRLLLDAPALPLFGAAEHEISLAAWLRRLPAAEAAALAAALDNAAAPLAAVVTPGGRRLLLRGGWAAGAWQGLALELPETADGDATPRARDELFAGISHELRTPLNAILGFTHLARAELPPGVDRSHVDHIEQASQLMLRVVNDLLDLVRLEAGRLEIEPDQPLDLHALAVRAGVLASGLRQGKPIRLYTTVDPECPQHLRGDAVRIEQVLANLIGNALKFTERGMVVLGVKLRERRDDEVTLRLSVSDTGVGIGLDHLQRIGRPFERSTRRAAGSGLGLSVVNRLLELHGTQLQVASVEGGGTICWFDLTLALDPTAVQPTPVADTVVFSTDRKLAETVAAQWRVHGHALRNTSQARRARRWVVDAALPEAAERIAQARRGGHDCVVVSAGPAPAGRPAVELPLLAAAVFARQRGHALAADPRVAGLRVMVVEDNELNRQVIAGFLRHLGAEVELFAAGAPALERLATARFDVALLDLQLDRESGLELAQALRATPAGAALPVIFLSAHFEEEDRMTAAGLGALACVSKPFDPDELRALLAPLPHERAPAPVQPVPNATAGPSLRALFACWPATRRPRCRWRR